MRKVIAKRGDSSSPTRFPAIHAGWCNARSAQPPEARWGHVVANGASYWLVFLLLVLMRMVGWMPDERTTRCTAGCSTKPAGDALGDHREQAAVESQV